MSINYTNIARRASRANALEAVRYAGYCWSQHRKGAALPVWAAGRSWRCAALQSFVRAAGYMWLGVTGRA